MSLDGQTVAVHLVVFTHYYGYIPGKKQIDDMFADAGYIKRRFGKVDHFYSTHVDQPLPPTMPNANKRCAAPVGEGAFDWGAAPGGRCARPAP